MLLLLFLRFLNLVLVVSATVGSLCDFQGVGRFLKFLVTGSWVFLKRRDDPGTLFSGLSLDIKAPTF